MTGLGVETFAVAGSFLSYFPLLKVFQETALLLVFLGNFTFKKNCKFYDKTVKGLWLSS